MAPEPVTPTREGPARRSRGPTPPFKTAGWLPPLRSSLLVCLLFLLLLLSPSRYSAQDELPHTSLSINVDFVELHVSVTDTRGRPLPEFSVENFTVTEDDSPQSITVFRHEDIPVSLGLVIDNSRSIEPLKARLDAAALSFVKASNEADEVSIVHFDFDARVSQQFTNDRLLLERALASEKPFGQTAMYDAVMLALDGMEKAQHVKKALLIVTDGVDNASKASLAQVLDRVKRNNVAVFVIGLISSADRSDGKTAMETLAKTGGGAAHFPQTPEEARTLMERIARDLRSQYTIGYRPTNPQHDGKWRSVRVRIQPPKGVTGNLEVSYRYGYYAPDPH